MTAGTLLCPLMKWPFVVGIEPFEVEGTFGGHLVQLFHNEQGLFIPTILADHGRGLHSRLQAPRAAPMEGIGGSMLCIPHGASKEPSSAPTITSSCATVYFCLLFPVLVAMHVACGRSSSKYRPHFDCSASWKMMIIIFDRREGGGRRSLGFQICSVISRILQGPSDFSLPKGNGVCIARRATGKILLFTRAKQYLLH